MFGYTKTINKSQVHNIHLDKIKVHNPTTQLIAIKEKINWALLQRSKLQKIDKAV